MKYFYWAMTLLILGTLAPSVLFFVLYLITGNDAHGRRASALWTVTRVIALVSFNILIWGHVGVALFQIWFR